MEYSSIDQHFNSNMNNKLINTLTSNENHYKFQLQEFSQKQFFLFNVFNNTKNHRYNLLSIIHNNGIMSFIITLYTQA